MKKVTENCSDKMNAGIIAREAKTMNNYPSISLIVWRLYVAILAPLSNYVSASVKDCSKNFNMKFEETTEINHEYFEKVMQDFNQHRSGRSVSGHFRPYCAPYI